MTFKRRHLLSVSIIAFTALAACKEEEDTSAGVSVPRPVLSMVVADVEAIRLATYPGRAQAVRELNIAFEVPGKILARPVDVGAKVKEGDVLAILDADPYAARVRSLEGQRAALTATLENARIELARREKLVKDGFLAEARLDDQIAVVRSTEANIEATDGALDEARLNLGYTTLQAPFEGTVSETFAERFQNVMSVDCH